MSRSMQETSADSTRAWGGALLYLVLWGLVDWKTGSELSLSVFYLPAVAWVAWHRGRLPAVAVAFLAGMVWLLAELGAADWGGNEGLLLWNASVRFGFFCITGVLVSEVRMRRSTEKQLEAQRAMLSKILNALEDGVVVIDQDQRLILANPAASKSLRGFAEVDEPEKWWQRVRELHAGGDAIPSSAWSAPGIEDGETAKLEFSIEIPETGDERRFEMDIETIAGKDRDSSLLVLVSRDRTDRYQLEKRITEISEFEKRQIGQEIHDGLCQQLAALAFETSAWQAELDSSGEAELAKAAGRLSQRIQEAVRLARNISHGLFPAGMEDGLDSGLRLLAETFQLRSGFQIQYHSNLRDCPLTASSSIHLYRIAQEAVSNAVRHSAGTKVEIELLSVDGELQLGIRDDGRGMPSTPPQASGIGIAIMRHRASIIHGRLEIDSPPGGGVRVLCRLPGPIKGGSLQAAIHSLS